MEFALIIFRQTLLMSLYMLIGYLLYRGKKVDVAGSRSIAAMLVWVVIPATIIKSCLVPYSSQRLLQMGQCFLLAAAVLGFAMLAARLCFRRDAVAQFSAAFSNAGFIGIPLVQASLGDEAVVYLIGIPVLIRILRNTHRHNLEASIVSIHDNVHRMTQLCSPENSTIVNRFFDDYEADIRSHIFFEEKVVFKYVEGLLKGERVRLSARNILLNPVMIAAIIGIGLFASGLGTVLPDFCTGMISGVAALNAPLAMIVLGVYLAQTELKELLTSARLYAVSAVRLLLIPCLTIPLLLFLPGTGGMKMALMIAAAAPVGANVAVYSQLYDTDYAYACETVTQSTVFSIVTLPLICVLAGLVIR